ncbi:hypothetical protein [Catelliglobosispora koreensis]|uniref:hypothetical protein n=1 Tax=Catelliglobosispora koreensis TaxID=129052 RepID=UPI000381FF55|nr:hypothetical protein [Catelliglobosispora koreensis]
MVTVTADDVRKLARGEHGEVLAVIDGAIHLVPRDQVNGGVVLYTRETLISETGVELTEMEAETLAAGLTAKAAGL